MGSRLIDPLPMARSYGIGGWKQAFDEMDALQHAKSIILPNA
ncbi:hypothetical protein [Paenibacillus sacheonensis]|nr:hypothetical protein [Paenibacillus sacheonensis]MBM7566047.1 hypothetical protein [Paenibacillus sacheonensis]